MNTRDGWYVASMRGSDGEFRLHRVYVLANKIVGRGIRPVNSCPWLPVLQGSFDLDTLERIT